MSEFNIYLWQFLSSNLYPWRNSETIIWYPHIHHHHLSSYVKIKSLYITWINITNFYCLILKYFFESKSRVKSRIIFFVDTYSRSQKLVIVNTILSFGIVKPQADNLKLFFTKLYRHGHVKFTYFYLVVSRLNSNLLLQQIFYGKLTI